MPLRDPTKIIAATLLLLAAASLCVLSCNRESGVQEEWVIRVNGEPIGVREFEGEFSNMTYGMDPVDKKASENPEMRSQILQYMVESRLLAAEARKQGVSVTKEEVEAGTRGFFNAMSKADRKRYLEALKLSEDDIKARYHVNMLVEKFLRSQIFSRIVMKSEDLKTYYAEHPECYREPERVRVRQIVTASEDEARKVVQRLEAGEDFAKVAAEVSLTPEKDRGGDLGWIERGSFPEPFDSIFFELPENKLSDIVRGDFGHHVIKVVERRSALERPSFEKVEMRVRQCYFDEAKRNAEMKERKRLLDAAEFELNPKYNELKVLK